MRRRQNSRPRRAFRLDIQPVSENDNISRLLSGQRDIVPDDIQGTDRFLDIVTWNIRFFNERKSERVETIIQILSEINADIFAFQEIRSGSMDLVAEALNHNGSGTYEVAYGNTGGDQRLAIMYDLDFVRASENIVELFDNPTDNPKIDDSQAVVFPRLPLYGVFEALQVDNPFTFDLVNIHLKAQGRGRRDDKQRKKASKRLADWLSEEAPDDDVIILGDFNSVPSDNDFEAFQALEEEESIRFAGFNPEGVGSHFYRGQRSRLDLIVVSEDAAQIAKVDNAAVIEWNQLLDANDAELEEIILSALDDISDHLPVITRFYFTENDDD